MSGVLTAIVSVLVFVLIAVLVQAIAQQIFTSRDKNRRVNRRLTMLDAGMDRSEIRSVLLRQYELPFDAPESVKRLYSRMADQCRSAGLEFSPQRLIGLGVVAAVGMWLFSVLMIMPKLDVTPTIAAVSFFGSFALVWLVILVWLSLRKNKRLGVMEQQMLMSLDIINRALRAGHPVISAVSLAARELNDPIASELGLVVDEVNYGVEFRNALVNFARRTGLADARFFAVSVSIQSDTGGNLVEVLEGLAKIMRDRTGLAQRVKALSSEGRASAMLLSVLPVFVIVFFMATAPSFYVSKFDEPMFWQSVAVLIGLYVVGIIMIYRITHFRY
jgi:tight adherence protein B